MFETKARSFLLGAGLLIAPADKILFLLAEEERVPISLKVYSAAGRHVRTLLEGSFLAAGMVEVEWDGTNRLGREVVAGAYLIRLTAGSAEARARAVLVR